MVNVCTIIARNYVAHARVLAHSFLDHHSDGRFTTLIVDDEQRSFKGQRERFRILRLADLDLGKDEIRRLAAIYDVTELATAVKPALLRFLLSEGADHAIYLDPDIKVYDSLAEVARLAHAHSIVLTPHTTTSLPVDSRRVDDLHILAAGVYNLGFIAVGPRCEDFIDWWWRKTRRSAHVDPQRMLFTDQRWVDFVPGFFEHFILKDTSYNVAYWNLHSRQLDWDGSRYRVDHLPLKFFHFSGFDHRKPFLLSKHQGERPRILLSERPALARICREYLQDLERAGVRDEGSRPYGWNELPNGVPFDKRMRRLYWHALQLHESGSAPEPPSPFEGTGGRFLEWLKEPENGLRNGMARYLWSIYQDRPDLRRVFPEVTGADRSRYFEWVRTDGVAQERVPSELLPPRDDTPGHKRHLYVPAKDLAHGVNVAGYLRAELGIGEAARQLTTALEAAGIPHSTLCYMETSSRQEHTFAERGRQDAPYDVTVVCVNADQTPAFARAVGPRFFDGRHTVGYWFWELEQFPASMHQAFVFVDEVWAATTFVAKAIRAVGQRPTHVVPLPLRIPEWPREITRAALGLPDGFLFLFSFDFFSVLERKNPMGLIEAFKRAFPVPSDARLVIKSINGEMRLNELERVRAAAAGREDIVVVDGYYSPAQKNALMALCDCYVSLHRSEGLGLTMLEAMALGKPVIATAYSGNLDFMTPVNSYLVDYSRGAVPDGCPPYPEGTPWADPDLDQAAELMRRVYIAREEARARGVKAREDVLTRHSPEAAARSLTRRLDAIHRERVVVGGTPTSSNPARFVPEHGPMADQGEIEPAFTPVPSVPSGRKFRAPLLAAQKLLFRVLRPYWWQQRDTQRLMFTRLRELEAAVLSGVAEVNRQRQSYDGLWNVIQRLQAQSSSREGGSLLRPTPDGTQTGARHPLAGRDVADPEGTQLSPEQRHGIAVVGDEFDHPGAMEARVAESVTQYQLAASAHLNGLTERLDALSQESAILSARLYAAPYTSDRSRFVFVDENGRDRMGFQSGRHAAGDVYAGFEDIFRGSEEFIRDRLRVYLPLLTPHNPVIEIGCGRGEMLDLLTSAGVNVTGVDIDPGMVVRCRSRGHCVEQADAITFLGSRNESSVSAIFAAQVVEHLPYEQFLSFLELSLAKLKPGGQLIFETVNPHALEAFKTFWTDLSHQKPIFPEVALAWCWLVGFDRAYVMFPNGTGELDQDRRTQGEYAVVATKRGGMGR